MEAILEKSEEKFLVDSFNGGTNYNKQITAKVKVNKLVWLTIVWTIDCQDLRMAPFGKHWPIKTTCQITIVYAGAEIINSKFSCLQGWKR